MSNESMDIAGHTVKYAVSELVKYDPQPTICEFFCTFDLRWRHVSQARDARDHRFGGAGGKPWEAVGLGKDKYGLKLPEGGAVIAMVGRANEIVCVGSDGIQRPYLPNPYGSTRSGGNEGLSNGDRLHPAGVLSTE